MPFTAKNEEVGALIEVDPQMRQPGLGVPVFAEHVKALTELVVDTCAGLLAGHSGREQLRILGEPSCLSGGSRSRKQEGRYKYLFGAVFDVETVCGPLLRGRVSRVLATRDPTEQARALTVDEVGMRGHFEGAAPDARYGVEESCHAGACYSRDMLVKPLRVWDALQHAGGEFDPDGTRSGWTAAHIRLDKAKEAEVAGATSVRLVEGDDQASMVPSPSVAADDAADQKAEFDPANPFGEEEWDQTGDKWNQDEPMPDQPEQEGDEIVKSASSVESESEGEGSSSDENEELFFEKKAEFAGHRRGQSGLMAWTGLDKGHYVPEGSLRLQFIVAIYTVEFIRRATLDWMLNGFKDLRGLGIKNLGGLAFACGQPGSPVAEAEVRTLLDQAVRGKVITVGDVVVMKRLIFEAQTSIVALSRAQADPAADPSMRKMPAAERAARLTAQKARLTGLDLQDTLEVAHSVYDMVNGMVESDTLKYLSPAKCITRMQEITSAKPPKELKLDSSGSRILVKDAQSEQTCSVSSELDIMEAMTRRSLAFDAVTRDGIKPKGDGTRPLDQILEDMHKDHSVVYYMLPTVEPQKAAPKAKPDKPDKQNRGPWKVPSGNRRKELEARMEASCASSTPDGSRICFAYNIDGCSKAAPGESCEKGKHVCATKGCYDKHLHFSCNKK
eukprot:s2957_g9.t1